MYTITDIDPGFKKGEMEDIKNENQREQSVVLYT